MSLHRRISHSLGACAIAALALTVAACGGSSPSSSHTSSPPATSPSTSAVTQITQNWEAFFNPKTPTSQRIALLQDGSQFQSVIESQVGSSLASQASAKVTNVTITSPTQATVKYDILLNGQPALSNQTGTAVLENGTWKVGVSSFCGLLTLENGGKTTGLPTPCQSA